MIKLYQFVSHFQWSGTISTAKTELIKTELIKKRAVNQSTPQTKASTKTNFVNNLINNTLNNKGFMGQGLVNQGLASQGLVNQNLVNNNLVNQSLTAQSLVNQVNLINQGLVNQRLNQQNFTNQPPPITLKKPPLNQRWAQGLVFVAIIAVSLTGCSTLSSPTPAQVIQLQRQNITTSRELSLNTQSIVIASGFKPDDCFAQFDACLTAIDRTYLGQTTPNQNQLATLAELHLGYALYLKQSNNCTITPNRPPLNPNFANAPESESTINARRRAKQHCHASLIDELLNATRYSYAYLFYSPLHNNHPLSGNLVSETQIRTQDIYHVAVHTLIERLYHHGDLDTLALTSTYDTLAQSPALYGTLAGNGNRLGIYVANNPYLSRFEQGTTHALSQLSSIYDDLPKLNVTATRSGLGVGYVGTLKERYQTDLDTLNDIISKKSHANPKARIHPMGYLLMTAVIIPKGDTLSELIHTNEFDLHFLNPYDTSDITILGQSYPVFAGFSSGYAKWLDDNGFKKVAFASLIGQTEMTLPELFMLEPYNPNKKVILMLHGLASSPHTWVQLTNSLLADPVLREQYQVWQILYPTNLPILENRYQIQTLIETAFSENDPQNNDPASTRGVIIGHSMGAVIARLMLSDTHLMDNLPALNASDDDYRLLSSPALIDRLTLHPLSQIDTAIFISAPFQGTHYADRWLARTLSRAIYLPTTLSGNDNSPLFTELYQKNAANQLSDKSALIQLTKTIAISPKVRYHSIIANDTDNANDKTDVLSDGVVPYDSSHLEGADSEIVLTGGHRIHNSPSAILYLRQLLHRHLAQSQNTNPPPAPNPPVTNPPTSNQ